MALQRPAVGAVPGAAGLARSEALAGRAEGLTVMLVAAIMQQYTGSKTQECNTIRKVSSFDLICVA